MQSIVSAEFRMKRRPNDLALSHSNDVFLVSGNDLHLRARFLHPRGPNEDADKVLAFFPEMQINHGLKALCLPAEGVPTNLYVKNPEKRLLSIRRALGQKNKPSAGSQNRDSPRASLNGGSKSVLFHEKPHGSTLTAGDYQPFETVQIAWQAHLGNTGSQIREGSSVLPEGSLQRENADLWRTRHYTYGRDITTHDAE